MRHATLLRLAPWPALFLTLWLIPTSSLAVPPGCTEVSSRCVEEAGTRLVEGFRIWRSCWARQIVYSCPKTGPGGACQTLSNAPDCTRTGGDCVRRAANGICLVEQNMFTCRSPKSGAGISFEGQAPVSRDHQVRSPIACGSELFCPDGDCRTAEAEPPSPDFGKAAAWMGFLTRLGKEKDPDAVTLFRGTGRRCTRWRFGSKNCCAESGWLLKVFGCSESEAILAEKRKVHQTHYVGMWCRRKVRFFGCVSRGYGYCTFQSRFARIFQEQARKQLGMGWGSPWSPDCRSLSIEEMQRIDFLRLDLSELYADLLEDANLESPDAVGADMQRRIEEYYQRQRQ